MGERLNLRELMTRENHDLESLEVLTIKALFHLKEQVREENKDYLSLTVIVPDKSDNNWVTDSIGPEKKESYYKIKSVFVEEDKIYLLLEHAKGLREIAFLCDVPKEITKKVKIPDYSGFNITSVSEEQF